MIRLAKKSSSIFTNTISNTSDIPPNLAMNQLPCHLTPKNRWGWERERERERERWRERKRKLQLKPALRKSPLYYP